MKKLSFRKRINAGFILVFILMLFTTLYSIWQLNVIREQMQLVYDHPFQVSNSIREIQIEIYNSAQLINNIKFADTESKLDSLITKVHESNNEIINDFNIVNSQYLGNKNDVKDIYNTYIDWENIKKKIYKFKRENKIDSLNQMIQFNNQKYIEHIISHTKKISDFASNKAKTTMIQTYEKEKNTLLFVIVLVIVVSLVVFLISNIISKSINKPIKAFIKEANSIFLIYIENFDSNNYNEEALLNYTIKNIKQSYQNIEQQNEEIKSSNEQLLTFNKTLEEKVNERTIVLKEKNEEIDAQNEEYKQINEELREAKEKAEESEEHFRNLFEQASDGIFISDTTGKYIDVNTKGCTMLGYTQEEIRSKYLGDFISKEDTESNPLKLEDLSARKDLFIERQLVCKNGTLLTVEISAKMLSNGLSQGILRDITERKKVQNLIKEKNEEIEAQNEEYKQINEELREAKDKAEESERLKSAFLSNMSHEIRTPLNIITGYSEFLVEDNLSKTERAEYISLINTNSIRLINLIDNILDLSKIEVGQKIVTLKNFNINKLMDELFDQNKKAVEKKQLELRVHKGIENEQTLINSSEQLIYQIFTNLINNALKYSLSGRIDYGYVVKDNEIELFVSDTGIGISKEYKTNIFKRFSQENAQLSRTYEGAGLGLSIVKGIVDLLGGIIDVNSEKGKGTTFKITLPLNSPIDVKKKQQNNNIIQNEIQNGKKIILLIVEDDLASFHLINKQILREFNCEIIHAINGKIAIEKVNAHPEITCVLMDMHLPDIDGCETTEIIKKIKNDMPVFAVTAAVMEIDKEKAIKAGCDEFLSKPVNREKLYEFITKYNNDRLNPKEVFLTENETINITPPIEKTLNKNEKIVSKSVIEILNEKYITLLIVEDDEACFYLLNMQISEEIKCNIIHANNGLSAIDKVIAHPEITCVLMDLHMPGIDGCETTERIKKIKKDLPVFAVTAAIIESAKEKALKAGCDEFFSKPVDRNNLYEFIVKYDNARQN